MAAKAFLLIEATMGETKEVVTVLEGIKGVKSVDAVTGPYDVIAVVEIPDVNALADLVTKRIHSVSGVARTVTCITARLGEPNQATDENKGTMPSAELIVRKGQ